MYKPVRLDTRVIGMDILLVGPIPPVGAYVVERAAVGDGVLYLVLSLDELQCEAHGDMPADVTCEFCQ